MKQKNPHASLIAFLGGGSRKIGLWVLLALIGVVPLATGRLTWEKYLGGLTGLAAIVMVVVGLEDSAQKRGATTTNAVEVNTGVTKNVAPAVSATNDEGGSDGASG